MKSTDSMAEGPDGISRVERARRRRGWTATELARRAGTSATVISRVEAGQRPGASLRERISEALGLPESELFATAAEIADAAASEVLELWREVTEALGEDFYRGKGYALEFIHSPEGRPGVRVGPLTFIRVAGLPVAGRSVGGRAEWAALAGATSVDELRWRPAGPAGPPGLN
ncbi:helix-turn-helix transcriptional regulator [Thermoleophilia bacterium SCSIO 60948]|nr:helix-turn-helix transcriptional regulator [Thermoleophilia bacterium SCSIO 60948]